MIVGVFEEAELAESSLDLVTAATFHWRNPDRSNGDYPIALSVEAGGTMPLTHLMLPEESGILLRGRP